MGMTPQLTLSHHPYIYICQFATAYTNMLCNLLIVAEGCGRQFGGYSAGSACWCAMGVGYVVGAHQNHNLVNFMGLYL